MMVIFFIFLTLLSMHLCTALYVLSQKLVGESFGARAEVVQVGTNLFFKPLKFFWGHTELHFGILPLSGHTKFFDNRGDENQESYRHSPKAYETHKEFLKLPLFQRMLLLTIGPVSSLLLGIGFLGLAVSLGGRQVRVGGPAESHLPTSSVPNLSIQHERASVAGQRSFLENSLGEFCYRIATGRSLKGWGGLNSWIVTCGYAGAASPSAWVSCVALLMVANGVLNLLPIPLLNGGHIVLAVLGSIFGSRSETLQLRASLIGLVLILAIFGYTLWLDLLWFVEQFL